MKTIRCSYRVSSCLKEEDFSATARCLQQERDRIGSTYQQMRYDDDRASVVVIQDKRILRDVQRVIAEKKCLEPRAMIVIGIGGSNLGTLAVHQALHGALYNERHPAMQVYFADTVDSDSLSCQIAIVQEILAVGDNVLLNVVTKSGATTETIACFELFLGVLKEYRPKNYHEYIVVTSDADSQLAQFAYQEQMTVLDIPEKIGGRYSVFTAVGLFPLGMLGVDLEELLAGARAGLQTCVQESLDDNPALASAVVKYLVSKHGVVISDFFTFSKDLAGIGLWYRQLMGESLGKTRDNGTVVGMTPTVSIGSIDLHSVGQLYLGGPKDKITTFLAVAHNKTKLEVPTIPDLDRCVSNIQGVSVSFLMEAIISGVQTAYTKHHRPCMSLMLPEKTEYWIGYLMQMYMVEMMFLGVLFEVNPFDQPHVELYKKETRILLSGRL
ncbi:hypothetical protein JW872_01730 [Candidatus Babeliales bacterium]|nr:hypothetical protein [Candidatus Babeliales bacterium]